MKLAAKLISILVVGFIAILVIDGYFSVQRQLELYEQDIASETELLGRTLKSWAEELGQSKGGDHVLKMIAQANRNPQELHIRWIWLDEARDALGTGVPEDKLQSMMSGKETSFKTTDVQGLEFWHTCIPVSLKGQRPGVIELSLSLSASDAHVRSSVQRIVILSIIMILLSGLLVMFMGVTMVGRPLHRLMEKARKVGTGDLSGPLDLKGNDELAELASALNSMCDQLRESQDQIRSETDARIAALEQLRHADRLRTVGRLASGIAHQLGTPLNVVSGRADLIASGDLSDEEVKRSARTINSQAASMTKIIRQLLDFARRRSLKRTSTDLGLLLRQTIDLLDPLARKKNSVLTPVNGDGPINAMVDAGQIQQVMTNLLVNAMQAMPSGGEVKVGIVRQDVKKDNDSADYFRLWVKDAGHGIKEASLPHLFEPFFTTKDIGEGTGLGLSIAYGIVSEHGGWIEVESTPGEGSCFSVFLPAEEPE